MVLIGAGTAMITTRTTRIMTRATTTTTTTRNESKDVTEFQQQWGGEQQWGACWSSPAIV